MSNEALALIGTTALDALATKYAKSPAEIIVALTEGNEGLRANFDELVQTGLRMIARRSLGYCA